MPLIITACGFRYCFYEFVGVHVVGYLVIVHELNKKAHQLQVSLTEGNITAKHTLILKLIATAK